MAFLREKQVVRDTYEVERFVGEGAFAEVYRVKHRFLGRQAMKVFKLAGMSLEEAQALLEEAILLSRIGHPNIVRVFEANTLETDGGTRAFFTMEFVAGGSLETFWRSQGARFLPVATAVDVLRQACRGLAVAHGESPPIVHRDVKPANLLVGHDPAGLHVRVSDFGLAKRVNPLTLLASARGTWAFKAPEAFAEGGSDSCAGDVWALGSTLYLLLTDRLPFFDADAPASSPPAFGRPLVPAGRFNILVEPPLEAVLSKALAKRPEDRYPTAKELLAALDSMATAPPASSPRADPAPAPTPPARRSAAPAPAAATPEEAVSRALLLSQTPGRLSDAADLLDQALSRWPHLRPAHEYRLRLWRRGVTL